MTNRNQRTAARNSHTASKRASRTWSRARASDEHAKPTHIEEADKAVKKAAGKTPSKRQLAQQKAEAEFAKAFGKPGGIIAAAKKVKATPKARVLPKKEKPVSKRVETDAETLAKAKKFFGDLAKKGELSKVGFVRELAAWNKEALQRRDVHAIVAEFPKLEIAPATVSTQFQLVRSGALQAK